MGDKRTLRKQQGKGGWVGAGGEGGVTKEDRQQGGGLQAWQSAASIAFNTGLQAPFFFNSPVAFKSPKRV